MTHPVFLERYSNILQDKGLIHLKTDSQFLHGYTLGIIEGHQHHLEDAEHDIYNAVLQRENMDKNPLRAIVSRKKYAYYLFEV